ncbi:PEP-CTERM sorting domain-containing protein [Coraliomargarita algicola]|uniref:PEP-CTERM sorting domain-containing protein n=1 Tax=Coraliomargarita algicola TaxID=3092156 RepID=A0ABZ0RLA4_9BACT|nr:PEP-CTERM sorting domain-containing protein [Coraliomargarita sp. J2-16]WPJ96228.1 PEP-CTERM sorting domain-containing protein [Coraliomargarita sp. J2-16]
MSHHTIKFIASAAVLLAFTQTTQAANFNWTGGAATDDWNEDANFGGADISAITTADQLVFAGAGDSNAPTADFVFNAEADVTARDNVVITIGTGVNISGFNQFRLAANSGLDGATLTMTGGSLSGASMTVASSPSATSDSFFNVSGGALATTGAFLVRGLGNVNLNGDDASLSVGSVEFQNDSVLNATFDSSGISTIASAGDVSIGASALLNFDFSSFAETGVFELFTGTIVSSYDLANVTGLGALSGGRTATLGSDADSIFVTIAVPEPSAYALLVSLAGLVFVMVRRRA